MYVYSPQMLLLSIYRIDLTSDTMSCCTDDSNNIESSRNTVFIPEFDHEDFVLQQQQDLVVAAGAYPGFCSMKRLGVFLLPLDGMLQYSPSQVTPRQFFLVSPTIHQYPFIDLGGERHCES